MSLTGTGLVVLQKDRVLRHRLYATEPHPTSAKTREPRIMPSGRYRAEEWERIDWIVSGVKKSLRKYRPTLVTIEGPSFQSKGQGQVSRYELLGIIKHYLRQQEYLHMVLPPTSLKLYATGYGKADKDQMIAAAAKEGFRTKSDDEADAFWLAHHAWNMGLGLMEYD